jgi:2-methylcitrate dehydratase PrpD
MPSVDVLHAVSRGIVARRRLQGISHSRDIRLRLTSLAKCIQSSRHLIYQQRIAALASPSGRGPKSNVQTAPIETLAASSAGLTLRLAALITQARDKPLPKHVGAAAARAFANWLGCALGAQRDPAVIAVRKVASATGSDPQSSLIGRHEMLDAVNAALVNAVAANALDYDDMHVPTLIHATGAVAAAAYAMAEYQHAAGAALIKAITIGIEVECRLGVALFPSHYDSGWHITATVGTLGAAAAACVIAGLDVERTVHALGIASTQASGLRAMLSNPCKSFNIGRAASAGLLAAQLSRAGLDSDRDALEAKFGFLDVFRVRSDVARVTQDFGSPWLVTDLSIKPYPCGVVIHPLIDACLEISRGRNVVPSEVRAITASVHARAIDLAGRRHPGNAIGGRFSLYHAAALALARQSAGISAFDDADVNDSDLRTLRDLMVIESDSSLSPRAARVRIEFKDGTCVERAIEEPSGNSARSLSDGQLREKFIELALRAMDEGPAQALFDECMSLADCADVTHLRRYWTTV